MNDPTIEHFVLGQFVHYIPAPPPPVTSEDGDEDAAHQAGESGQQSETGESDRVGPEEGTKEMMSPEKEQGENEENDREEGRKGEAKDEGVGDNGSSGYIETCASPAVEPQNATVTGVHRDDFPNIYYTIIMEGSDRERQTVASRLTPRETREEAEARLAEIQRKKVEEDRRRHEEALEEMARQEREAILKRKLEEKTALEATDGGVSVSDTSDDVEKSRDKKLKSKGNKKSISDKVSEKCDIS